MTPPRVKAKEGNPRVSSTSLLFSPKDHRRMASIFALRNTCPHICAAPSISGWVVQEPTGMTKWKSEKLTEQCILVDVCSHLSGIEAFRRVRHDLGMLRLGAWTILIGVNLKSDLQCDVNALTS